MNPGITLVSGLKAASKAYEPPVAQLVGCVVAGASIQTYPQDFPLVLLLSRIPLVVDVV
jgi:hypothetical protein